MIAASATSCSFWTLPGRTPYEAVHNFLVPIQRAVSCLAHANVRYGRNYEVGVEETLTIDPDGGIPVRLPSGYGELIIGQRYRVVETDDTDRGPLKVQTLEWRYRLEVEGEEVVFWHFDPERYPDPHVHVRGDDTHVPTGRLSIESVIRYLIDDLGADPLKPNWEEELAATEKQFKRWRTWS